MKHSEFSVGIYEYNIFGTSSIFGRRLHDLKRGNEVSYQVLTNPEVCILNMRN